ncbi:MAG TPA: UbiA family prenyltransferase [Massilia sp.]|nr:UbiA family prenyltransferase [Massilia sp.]
MSPPIVVDLDGTLIHTDMLHESALWLLRDNPLHVLRIPRWLMSGKPVLKQKLAAAATFHPASLPYNQPLLAWLQGQRAAGRKLILCTASDHTIAHAISGHLGMFDEVMASDGKVNLAGSCKARALVQRFGEGGFDYVGNSNADLAVWALARRAIVVNASDRIIDQARRQFDVEHVFPRTRRGLQVLARMLRVHQWMKNLLLFIPLIAGHQFGSADAWLALALAFVSFSLCASTVYILNDLLDLESDRQHPRKRTRPFASGLVPAWMGIALAPLLLLVSLMLGMRAGGGFLPWLCFYLAVTCAYSWWLKRLVLVDCLTLAMLYTLRIVAGAAAAGIALSFWLLAFSVFLFLSLAFVKRYAELQSQILAGKSVVHGRGYLGTDAPLVQMLGITSGYAAVVVLSLYLNSDAVLALYRSPEIMWGAVPVILFWVSWIWLQAHRGKMHDDPLVFAIRDRASLFAGLLFGAILALGARAPW